MLNLSKNQIRDKLALDSLYALRLINTPKKSRLIARWLMGIMAFLLLCLLLPWQQNVEGTGIVTAFQPKQRPQTLQTLIAGRIEQWKVNEGQFIHAGDTILVISEIKEKFFDPKLLERMQDQIVSKSSSMASKRDKVLALKKQIAALKNGLKFGQSKARNKIQQSSLYITIDSMDMVASKADNDISQAQFDRQNKLYQDGLVSLTNLEQRKLKYQQTSAKYISSVNKFSSAKNDLLNSELELNSIAAEYNDKISKAEAELSATESDVFESEANVSKMQIEYSNFQIRNNLYIIRAPQNGYLVKVIKQGIGETIKEGEEVAILMPEKPQLAVEMYIKPMDLPLIYKGCYVRLEFDGWPAVVFSGWPGASVGTFSGMVSVIDYVPSSNGKYRVLVTPDLKDTPWPEKLRPGSGALGWTMLNNVMVGYEIWRRFNGFPQDYYHDIRKEVKNISSTKKTKESKSTVDEEDK